MKPTLAFEKYLLPCVCSIITLSAIPVLSYSQTVDFGKNYFNVTKGSGGGTVETGDILEIRAIITVKAGTFDSCGYYDFIPSGTTYIPGSIRVLTNEGKIYKQFTDGLNDDCGWINGSAIRINLGYTSVNPATASSRGRVASNHKPTLYGSSCIMIASFRVTVSAALNSNINLGGGWFTYKNGLDLLQNFLFPANMVRVYPNYSLCTNILGTNMLGTEYDGTFGTGKSRNRIASASVPPSYIQQPVDLGTPFDNFYAIVNNTSTRSNYTTSNSWSKPDNSSPSHRVFGVWDIIGDHTNALTAAGNPAADTVTNNNGGYMLVLNSAYHADSVFQRTITGLCPNTYYEISAWVRNLCSKCGCDSNGTGATVITDPMYIPTGAGDSSGVHPNIVFEVNGNDYYSTGDILYTGQWIKKGFTYQTGSSQTSIILKLVNNAPGGGGNDWALDDISVATCSPNMSYAQTNPIVCFGNPFILYDTVKSSFNGYTYYIWQRSTNNGNSWTSVTSATGPATPVQNGANWEYVGSYTVDPAFTQLADSADQYRMIVGTSAANLSSGGCRFTESSTTIALNIIDCGIPLNTDLLSFTGRLKDGNAVLQWTMGLENEIAGYDIEKSWNSMDFSMIASVSSYNNGAEYNNYTYSDPWHGGDLFYYRIRIRDTKGHYLYSRTIQLSATAEGFYFSKVINPFSSELRFDVVAETNERGDAELISPSGSVVIKKSYSLVPGINRLSFDNTSGLAAGIYFLKFRAGSLRLQKTVLKQNK